MNPVNERTMQDLYLDTVKKICYLRERGFNVIEMWECDLKKELKENEEMRCYFEKHDLVDPLEPRDAFFGGRTNAAKQKNTLYIMSRKFQRNYITFQGNSRNF